MTVALLPLPLPMISAASLPVINLLSIDSVINLPSTNSLLNIDNLLNIDSPTNIIKC